MRLRRQSWRQTSTNKDAKGFIESQYEPTSVEAIDVWETLHGDLSTFPTNLAHRPEGPPAAPPVPG